MTGGQIAELVTAGIAVLGALAAYLRAKTAETNAVNAVKAHTDTTIHYSAPAVQQAQDAKGQ